MQRVREKESRTWTETEWKFWTDKIRLMLHSMLAEGNSLTYIRQIVFKQTDFVKAITDKIIGRILTEEALQKYQNGKVLSYTDFIALPKAVQTTIIQDIREMTLEDRENSQESLHEIISTKLKIESGLVKSYMPLKRERRKLGYLPHFGP